MGLTFQVLESNPSDVEELKTSIKDVEEEQDGKKVKVQKEVTETVKVKKNLPVSKVFLPYQAPYFDYEQYDELIAGLASRLGIVLATMVGYGGDVKWNTVSDPLAILLNKKGYELRLTAEECKSLEMPLRTLSANIENLYIRNQAQMLADLMGKVGKAGKLLQFC